MRTKTERRNSEKKELKHRIELCKDISGYTDEDIEYIKHKRDIPHSLGSNYWNAYETKSMRHKQDRQKNKKELKKEDIDD